MSKSKLFVATVLAVTGTLGIGAAQAHESRVNWSISIGVPVPVLPAPILLPAVVRPAPVIVQPAPYRHPAHYDRYAYGYSRPTAWDRDGDGVPNRRDRLFNPVWDRDGDGIPNGRDRFDNRRHDHDGDGIPNRY
ncbi:MAG TPA: hypothetical protein VFZ28_00360, partial [Burkholderiaceae bacterium]|nr:hypothetical protein [Burkholderiaceae bacterium]